MSIFLDGKSHFPVSFLVILFAHIWPVWVKRFAALYNLLWINNKQKNFKVCEVKLVQFGPIQYSIQVVIVALFRYDLSGILTYN